MADLLFTLIDEASLADIPAPARPGARCQTCDYWERLDGSRQAEDSAAARSLKLSRLLEGTRLAGAYGMLAWRTGADGDRLAVGWSQFGPISAYPRAQAIRDRYPELPESPAPWVITCLQVVESDEDREAAGAALLRAVCEELDRRGVVAVEAYPEGVADPWQPSPGPEAIYVAEGFRRAAGDDRYPVVRRELGGSGEEVGWDDLLARARPPDEGGEWPLPLPKGPTEDDLFRLPEKPKRPNPFGDD
ncbi:MAG TPA: hypothetical protein VFH63_04880 [candidate division Zixibacteria bacterium]|nr:hypothetical protein [candidate division Zixibacteria bacterium]